jgi:hypothetical protein
VDWRSPQYQKLPWASYSNVAGLINTTAGKCETPSQDSAPWSKQCSTALTAGPETQARGMQFHLHHINIRWTWKLQHLENCHHLPLGEPHLKKQQERSSMWSELKNDVGSCWQLSDAENSSGSSWRGSLWALTNPSDPSQRLRPTYHTAPMAITHHARLQGFVSAPSAASQCRRTPGPKNRERERGGYSWRCQQKNSPCVCLFQLNLHLIFFAEPTSTCSSLCWARCPGVDVNLAW